MGVIYMIRPTIPHEKNHIYIGSTTNTIEQRYTRHMYAYNNWLRGHRIDTYAIKIFAMYGFDNCECVLIETIEDKTELRKKEVMYLQTTDCVNKCKSLPKQIKQTKPIKHKPMTMKDIWEQNSTFTPYPIRL